jgi:hypothetical protein
VIEFFAPPRVYIVTSTDQDCKAAVIQVLTSEDVANDLVAALNDADTEGDYGYAVVSYQVVR